MDETHALLFQLARLWRFACQLLSTWNTVVVHRQGHRRAQQRVTSITRSVAAACSIHRTESNDVARISLHVRAHEPSSRTFSCHSESPPFIFRESTCGSHVENYFSQPSLRTLRSPPDTRSRLALTRYTARHTTHAPAGTARLSVSRLRGRRRARPQDHAATPA